MISVLMITYNQEKYLAQAIESVLMQKCTEPFEILIGDDCSTDSTGWIADEYQSRYPDIIRVIRPEKNGGATANGIRLVKEANGEYLMICDGDDYWLREDMMQMYYDTFRQNPEVGMICAKAKKYIQKQREYQGVLGYKGAEDLMTMLRDNQDVAAPTLAFRKDLKLKCISESKWYIDHNFYYDTVEAYWFAYNSKIKFIDEEVAVYRVLPNSACHTDDLTKSTEFERRYFAVKWHFILTHPDICNEEMFELLMREYDARTKEIADVSANNVRNSKSYRLGKLIVNFVRKLKKN